ncbi:tyrosine-type recombinase/integrase [Alicyclobacillus acidoterrestris]|uniref:Site-specific integrase n=1 Tax=Alicyclobacillus acidoterrestris (strain ATCC 49025 / DSM 3922 / CIP 106132 / NCIMB 13137 / GD3B) TaxID=1356854 RepID=T0BM84_ALIAG|nr:site-specific integrase [Alicyclobacillus acidoterrestris]EPZ41625.1 hypothetical protein N007_16675 [Alicyclobacillus acidoterrestris ATCC 49025]UNO50544.1 site-specific integrase [Alicyclobacillus acidoterrestris]
MEGQIIDRGINKRTGLHAWLIRVPNGTDAKGKRLYANRTIHGTKRDAERTRREMLAERDRGTLRESSRESLDDYLTRWLEVHKATVKERTYYNDAEMIDRYIRPHVGMIKLQKLSPLDVQTLYAKLGDQGLSSATIRRAHAVLHHALEQAVRWQIIGQNPARLVKPPKLIKPEMCTLTEDEAVRLLDECIYDQYGTLFHFLLMTGCRPGEAYGLHWSDIDFDSHTVTIRRALSRKGTRSFLSTTKTSSGMRTVSIFDESLLESLKQMKQERKERQAKLGKPFNDDEYVFVSSKGTPLNDRNVIQRHFKPLLKRVGINEDFRLYDLRHSTASLLLRLNVHPKVVAEMFGHSDITLTLNTYSHVTPGLQEEAAQKLSNLLRRR